MKFLTRSIHISRAFVRVTGFVLIFPVLLVSCTRCELELPSRDGEEVTILSYNVENLFDDSSNGNEYFEYDPSGETWNTTLYQTKSMHIAEAIKTSVQGGPDILALQEIENENTLLELRDTYLKNMRYLYHALVPAPDAAVNTAVLSRYPITSIKAHAIHLDGSDRLRNILEVHITIDDATLFLFNNHWKSKSGGAEETEPLRLEAAWVVKQRVAAILEEDPDADIVLAGDFNENIDEYTRIAGAYQTAFIPENGRYPDEFTRKSIVYTADRDHGSNDTGTTKLYSCWTDAEAEGSYYYRGRWETIDNIILSPGLFDEKGLQFEEFEVVDHSFLLNEKGLPKRWNSTIKKGYSDHLPLIATFLVGQ
jgi:endonuclease/exonuclease/phosphatase family metal-dependent hydrolase